MPATSQCGFYGPFVQVYEHDGHRRINLSRLPPETKRRLWEEIKRTQPALAALISSPRVVETLATFSGEIWIEDPESAADTSRDP